MPTAQRFATLRASAALPAAGALATGTSFPIDQGTEITLYLTYTRGGAAGAFQYVIEFSIDGSTWYQQAAVQEQAIAAGTDVSALSQRAYVSYTATSASAESFCSDTFTVPANWMRINVRETGNVGAPGTLSINGFLRIPL